MVLVWQIKDDSPNSPNFPTIRYKRPTLTIDVLVADITVKAC